MKFISSQTVARVQHKHVVQLVRFIKYVNKCTVLQLLQLH